MAFLEFKNVRISGISAGVPKHVEYNQDYPYFEEGEAEKYIASTSIRERRIADPGVCSSDLCYSAAERLIKDLGWDKSEIECLLFVSQTADYILPATSCILQERLGLPESCYAMDISLGCSGWVYGLSVITSLLSSGQIKKGLLLSGEICHLQSSPLDKSAYPLFGDAGTATALEYQDGYEPVRFHFSTDGSGYEAIIIRDGGYRHPFDNQSLDVYTTPEGLRRTRLNTEMDGMSVFSFGITKAPQSFNLLMERFSLDRESLDYFVMHQANYFMNNKIRKKLKLPEEKVPYSMPLFGNTSSASIPLTLVTACSLRTRRSKISVCGFGVGLSWGTGYFELDENVMISDLVEI